MTIVKICPFITANALQDLNAVELWQLEVQQHHSRQFRPGSIVTSTRVEGHVAAVAISGSALASIRLRAYCDADRK
jgi:hypothetical protein